MPCRLGVLLLEFNKLLIIFVVPSMALTPFLNDFGRTAADFIGEKFDLEEKPADTVNFDASKPVVILGFGQMGQVLANFLVAPLASGVDDVAGWPYVAFDIDFSVVKASRKLGFPVLYGDASRPTVLQSAGISSPRAIMVMYTGKKKTMEAVQRLRLAFPAVSFPTTACTKTHKHLHTHNRGGPHTSLLCACV
ncbi:K(+) efflux antiporter 3, chloroplastic-like [Rhododendron vialii]|uniref:K(+) efflux antiporter 3, chloroplastic-like n=1 Tax=Rhododendron vialii TaxID=182163 RepID=UPI00265F68BB|nr:K(+) efflux antiporter 3, chloroplastic-like [Rhododendron vialii]